MHVRDDDGHFQDARGGIRRDSRQLEVEEDDVVLLRDFLFQLLAVLSVVVLQRAIRSEVDEKTAERQILFPDRQVQRRASVGSARRVDLAEGRSDRLDSPLLVEIDENVHNRVLVLPALVAPFSHEVRAVLLDETLNYRYYVLVRLQVQLFIEEQFR